MQSERVLWRVFRFMCYGYALRTTRYRGIIRTMKAKSTWSLWIGVGLLFVSGLGAWQLAAWQHFLTRGMPAAFPAPVADAGLPRGCVDAALEQYTGDALSWALDAIDAGGFAWVRQRFDWAAIEPTPGEYDWIAWDRLVAEATARDLRLIAVLDTAPAWAGVPPDTEAFARFAGALAARYGEQLTYYQIWHNPNLGGAWGGQADPYGYTELLARAADAIRAADPDARILLGSLAPTVETGEQNYAEDLFLKMLYVAGAGPYFDIVSVQPYGFAAAPDERTVGRDTLDFSRAILIREALEAHGDGGKAVWASHFGWNSLPAGWPGPASIWGSVDEATQAAYTVAALERAEREWPWMGPLCLNGFQPRPETPGLAVPDAEEHWGFALVGPDGAPRPLYAALQAWNARPPVAAPGVYPASTALATFEGTWTLGPQGADIGQTGDRVRLDFEGTGVALTVRRGPYRAFLFVTVDGQPANALATDTDGRSYVVLYDPLAEIATVPLAQHLAYGPHTVEVVAERGWGQWALADWRVENAPERAGYLWARVGLALLGVGGAALCILAARRGALGAVGRALAALLARLSEGAQLALSLALSVVYLFSTWQLLMGQTFFRRLGEGGGLWAVLLAAGGFYLSPWLAATLISGAALSLLVFLRPALGLALTILAAPLYIHPLSLVGKSFALAELILLPTVAGWALQFLGTRPGEWRARLRSLTCRPFFWPAAAFLGVALLSTVFAAHLREAARELRLVVVEPLLFYAMLTSLPMERRERVRVLDFFVLSAALVAGVGLVQYFFLGDVITAEGGIQRLRSVYGSPNNAGLYLGRALPVLLAYALWSGPATLRAVWGAAQRRWYALALLPVGLALLLTLSKGALLLGVPGAVIALGLLAGGRWRRVTLILVVVGLLALIPLFRTPRFASLFDASQGTTFFRLSLWHSAWQMFLDHPLLGVGPDNFLYAYRTHYILPTAWEEFNLAHPHNVVLDFASRLGLTGLAVFVWLQTRFWRRVLPLCRVPDPARRALALGFVASMVDFLAHGLVDASYFVVDLAYAFFLTLAVVQWLAEDFPAQEARPEEAR